MVKTPLMVELTLSVGSEIYAEATVIVDREEHEESLVTRDHAERTVLDALSELLDGVPL
jgi:hypothetical protein